MGIETEARAYWWLARDIRLNEAEGRDASEARDDLDVIRLYTDSAHIKRHAAALLAAVPNSQLVGMK
jgi:hypothetical protein